MLEEKSSEIYTVYISKSKSHLVDLAKLVIVFGKFLADFEHFVS